MRKISGKDVIAFCQGNLRYLVYGTKFNFLIRWHIQEQINFRIEFMQKKCYDSGSCERCGCSTTALQMANKCCDKPCYPPMLNEEDWDKFISGKEIFIKDHLWQIILRQRKNGDSYGYLYLDTKLVHNRKLFNNVEAED